MLGDERGRPGATGALRPRGQRESSRPQRGLPSAGRGGRLSAGAAGEDPVRLERMAQRLLAWYDEHGRTLPWRGLRDPYPIWVSEIMLQQTRVETVLPHFERFLARFPSLASLAAASDEEARAQWSGLGFYRRAHNLHRAARRVVAERGGALPADPAYVASLPGVGRYTLGAILSAAFDLPLPIVDGNVTRILARAFLVTGDPRRGEPQRRLWALAQALLPATRPGDTNQALMDLGATVCAPRGPACQRCPWASDCQGRATGAPERLPERAAAPLVPTVRRVALRLARPDGALLLVQRPAEGLLASLWELPSAEPAEGESDDACAAALARRCGLSAPLERRGLAEHRFSHRHWRVQTYAAAAGGQVGWPEGPQRWATPGDFAALGVPTATRKVLAAAERAAPAQLGLGFGD